jgi:hypothetical protein
MNKRIFLNKAITSQVVILVSTTSVSLLEMNKLTEVRSFNSIVGKDREMTP